MIRKRTLRNSTRLHERNFDKLSRVIPGLAHLPHSARLQADKDNRLELEVLEKSRYTTTFSLQLQHHQSHQWLPSMQMKIRAYHDAGVAEVLAFQRFHRVEARYEYPNPQMHQTNEKWQFNDFLSDWLDYCLRNNCLFRKETVSLDA
jgi:uncharacterized protein YqiB (DUF1249 family)